MIIRNDFLKIKYKIIFLMIVSQDLPYIKILVLIISNINITTN